MGTSFNGFKSYKVNDVAKFCFESINFKLKSDYSLKKFEFIQSWLVVLILNYFIPPTVFKTWSLKCVWSPIIVSVSYNIYSLGSFTGIVLWELIKNMFI